MDCLYCCGGKHDTLGEYGEERIAQNEHIHHEVCQRHTVAYFLTTETAVAVVTVEERRDADVALCEHDFRTSK